MERVDLIKIEHGYKVGDECPRLEQNIIKDSVFYENGEVVGFYLSKMPDKAARLADLANAEFRSKNVPKSRMSRVSAIRNQFRTEWKGNDKPENDGVMQMSTLLGSMPPKPLVRRNYATMSAVHNSKSAQTFIKAMLMLANEAEGLMREIAPTLYEQQSEAIKAVPEKWRFANLFTSSISNYNISANMHIDAGNLKGCCNAIITKRLNCNGGNLFVPDYNAVMDSADNSLLIYPAWRNLHGVTPIEPTHPTGYRNSLIFYPLKAFVNLR